MVLGIKSWIDCDVQCALITPGTCDVAGSGMVTCLSCAECLVLCAALLGTKLSKNSDQRIGHRAALVDWSLSQTTWLVGGNSGWCDVYWGTQLPVVFLFVWGFFFGGAGGEFLVYLLFSNTQLHMCAHTTYVLVKHACILSMRNTRVCTHILTVTHTHACAHARSHTRMHARTHARTHTHTHTHKRSFMWNEVMAPFSLAHIFQHFSHFLIVLILLCGLISFHICCYVSTYFISLFYTCFICHFRQWS